MAVAVNVTTDKPTYTEGEPVVATVAVTGADPGGSKAVPVVASVRVDGVDYSAELPITVTWPADVVEVLSVTLDGVDMVVSPTDPMVWTGTAA